MMALQIAVNGRPLYTIGVSEFGLLYAGVDWGRIVANDGRLHEHLWIGARGMESGTAQHSYWQNTRLTIGDEVTIKVVDVAEVDAPLPGNPDFPVSS